MKQKEGSQRGCPITSVSAGACCKVFGLPRHRHAATLGQMIIKSCNPYRTASIALVLALVLTLPPLVTKADQKNSTVAAKPTVRNFTDNTTVRYPVVLLKGDGIPQEKGKAFAAIEVENLSSDRPTRKIRGQARGGKFKVLAELIPGNNILKISAAGASSELILRFQPQTNEHFVRVIWMTDSAGDTDFATPTNDIPQDYRERLDTALKLMQTFTAESMNDGGYGRRTFRLELDEQGKVVVHTLAAPKTRADYYTMEDQQWWNETRQWLDEKHPAPKAKNLVLAAFTRKDPETGKMLAHTALGGGNLGLFGSASVFSWPQSLAQTGEAFLNRTTVDPARVHDDSSGRHTWWGCASTTLGATLHEMGHTFGLPHCTDPRGIMTRGFDYFHRAFTLHEPPSAQRLKPFLFQPDDEARWAKVSASYLRWSPWFALDDSPLENGTINISVDEKLNRFTIESDTPIRWIGFWKEDNVAAHREIPVGVDQRKMSLSLAECEAEIGPVHPLTRLSSLAENGAGVTLRILTTKHSK